MKERAHWNKIGEGYQEEIFDVFKSDRNLVISKAINRYAGTSAIDFGCGTGRAFEYLCPSFKSVLGVDISDNLLKIAKKAPYDNLTLKRHDLTKPLKAKADFGFCCNVVMLPEIEKNRLMLKNIRKSVQSATVVMPSLESFFYSAWQLMEWDKSPNPSDLSGFKGDKTDLIQGVVRIDGVKTKHYLEPELRVLFRDAGFSQVVISKVEYDWTTEFSNPPKWMKDPYPWDWLVECHA